MDIVECLSLIDLLCAREFPAAHGRTEYGESGPGYHIAALRTSEDFREGDGSARDETEAQYEADRDGLAERLGERWGSPQHVSLYSVLDRSLGGEDMEEPWAGLSGHVPDVQLWRVPGAGRWVALGVSRWDRELPCQLLGIVTSADPP
ncbi:hypothetical protein JK361_31855 [Streptomyces sp. 5-8]|uniref:Uncharacterized protein n=1 Tax=Streptomyces musisoli TaxID=2802280 RepID=A0ABS1P9S8_9ACTN|nr:MULTISPECIES: hypothetical protein [Streptomyces]MBL1109130.1 hypothetical protein [Streptomyces musisoli]MBY8842583.1 hypothetical protein [Streptomyces sp. SP2-10]